MNWRRPAWWPGNQRKSHQLQEPGAALFQGLRVRLTLWYCGVLGVALLVFGVTLYYGTQHFLLPPVEQDAQLHAETDKRLWITNSLNQACPLLKQSGQMTLPIGQGFQIPEQVVCFNPNGSLLRGQDTTELPSTFLRNSLVQTAVQTALKTGKPVGEIVDAGGVAGHIYCYVLPVPNPTGKGNLGILLVGELIQPQESALSLLLMLLLSIGGVTLFGAGLGGLFLSNRALVPARLSWANQQRFVADAAHELRTPLTLLRADAEVLLRGRKRLEEEDAELLEDIVAEAHHMSKLATNLLTLARLDAGTMHQEHEVVNIAELAREGARRVQAFAKQRSVAVQVKSSDTYVIGDPLLLEQTLFVVLDNAIKYTQQGGRVTVRAAEQNGQALLEVSDTGIGIAAEHLPYLSERFYRVDKARSREAGGTGLGLSIAQRIVVAHGGLLSLSSEPEQGTTVTISLPLAHEDDPVNGAEN